jgi:hypothetical protein
MDTCIGLPPLRFCQNAAYAKTRIIRIIFTRTRMQIHVLYILYVCKYAYYAYPYPDTEYAGGNPMDTCINIPYT